MCHIPREQCEVLKNAIKLAWNSASFCPNEQTQFQLVTMVLELTGYACCRAGAKDRDALVKRFYDQWGDAILDGLNEHRQYVTGQVKEVCHNYWKENEKTLPPLTELKNVIMRKKDCDQQVFVWWWDKLLPMMPGSADVWGEKVRWFHTISSIDEKAPEKIRKLGRITPNLEAMAYVIIENNYKKWPCFWTIKAKNKDKKVKIVREKKAGHQDHAGEITVDMVKYPELEAKWTEVGKGQKKFGGWPQEAIEEHAKLRKKCASRRSRNSSAKLESVILGLVRVNHEIVGDSYEEYKAHIGKKPKAKSKNTGMVLEGYDMFGLDEGEGECNLSDDSSDDNDEDAVDSCLRYQAWPKQCETVLLPLIVSSARCIRLQWTFRLSI